MPKISIIIPAYNVDKYLNECLESVKKQTFGDFECICVNSSDSVKAAKILEKYESDPRFKTINTAAEGVSKARNTGLLNAKGEWIAFIDANDFITPDYMENLYNGALETGVNVIANNNITKFYSKRHKKEYATRHHAGVFDITPALVYAAIGKTFVWNKLYKASFLKETGINFPEGKNDEDSYFYYCLMSNVKQMALINKPSYFYRAKRIKNTDDLGTTTSDSLLDVFKLICDYYGSTDKNGFIPPFGLLSEQLKKHRNKKKTLDSIYEILANMEIDYTLLSDKDARFVKDIKDKKFIKLWVKSIF